MKAAAVVWVIKRYKILIIAITVLTFLTGLLYSMYIEKPVYRAKALVMVTTADEMMVQKFDYMTILANRQLAKVYSEIIHNKTVLDHVALGINGVLTSEQLKPAIAVNQVGGTELLEISTLAEDPVNAAIIANVTTSVFISHLEEMFKVSNVRVIEPAFAEQEPIKPNLLLNIVAATMLGFCAVTGTCITMSHIRQPVGMPGVIDTYIRSVAHIPSMNRKIKSWFKLFENTTIQNAFLYLQTILVKKAGSAKIIMLTSATRAEGKTTISDGLSLALCQSGRRVAIIDGDLAAKSKKNSFVLGGKSVEKSISSPGGVLEILQVEGCPELRIVQAATPIEDGYQFLSSCGFEIFLKNIAAQSDLVLIKAPALPGNSEALLLAAKADGVLLVASNKTPLDRFKKALYSLETMQAHLLGVVLNDI